MTRLVDVYPYQKAQEGIEFLIFKRSADVEYAGQWRMIGGKVREKEERPEAAVRELEEETGLKALTFWTVPSVNKFYDHRADVIHNIAVFAAEVNGNDQIELNHEHVNYQWISPSKISEYINWPEQRRLMHLIEEIVINNEILNEWKIDT